MNNAVLIICESFYNGNTLRLAKAMANEINCKLVTIDEARNIDIKQYKVVGFGAAIVFAKHAPRLMKYISELEASPQKAFVFSTRGNPILGAYHKPITELLTSKGRNVIGGFSTKGYDGTGPFTIVGGGSKGRPNEKDQRKAAAFIRDLLPEYKRIDYYLSIKDTKKVSENNTNTYTIKADGKNLTLRGDLVTVLQNECIGCGLCTQKCPLQVFELENKKSIPARELDCVQCSLCQSFCPQKSIYIHGTWKDAIRVAKRHAHRI